VDNKDTNPQNEV